MKQYSFDIEDVERQFIKFMQSLDIQPYDHRDLIFDGELHRYRVHDDKQSEKSGAYLLHLEGWPAGFVQDWRKGIKENWKYDISGFDDEQRKYFSSEEYRKKCELEHKKAEAKRKAKQARTSEHARLFWDTLPNADDNHPYLIRKHVKAYGLRINAKSRTLAVPLRNINGQFQSIQWIPAEEGKHKLFYEGASLDGAFFSYKLPERGEAFDGIILLGEGYATMAKIHELTGLPIVAAMSCHRLREVAVSVHNAYPNARIVITADNDWETEKKRGFNPGLFYAKEAGQKKFNVQPVHGMCYPDFKPREHGSDWDDFAIIHGDTETAAILNDEIRLQMLPDNIRQMVNDDKLQSVNAQNLRFKKFDPIKWVVPGIIPSGLSILGGGPKTGKSLFVLDVGIAVAIGGYVFGQIHVEQGDALYLALEDNERRLQERIDFINLDEQDDLSRLTLVTRIPRQHEGGIEYITWWLDEHPEARVVIIDTLQMFRQQLSGKGNVYAEDYEVISSLRTIAINYNIAVLVLHHLKKTSARESLTEATNGDWINAFSGSIGLTGSADSLFMLRRDRMGKLGRLYRTGRDIEECEFELVLEGLRWDLKGEVNEILLPTWKLQILNYLSEHSKVSPADLATGFDLNIKTAQTNLRRLEREGVIQRIGYGTYALNPDNAN